LRNLDGGQRTDVAIEVAAALYRINVRAEQDGFPRGIRARPLSKDVAGRIDGRLQASFAHQPHRVAPAGDIGV
jgi:hypothetical protein